MAGIQRLENTFQLLVTQEMVLRNVEETNERAETDILSRNKKHPGKFYEWKKTDRDEIWAVIGLLILEGVQRCRRIVLTVYSAFVDSMSCRLGRRKREKTNWHQSESSRDCYVPGDSITVDKQLVTMRSRCKFRQ